MDLSERNKKVAIARWKNRLEQETKLIRIDKKSMLLRSSICGFLAGDGSVQIRKEKTFYHYQLDFFPDDKDMLENYIKQIKYVYDKIPVVKEKHNYFTVRITSKNIIMDLLKYAKFGLKKWAIPEILLNIEDADKYWLKAFFSAEGTVNSKRIKIQSINREGIIQVSKLLENLGIDHKKYEYTPKNKNYNKVYMIFILKKNARKIFQEKIGFWHSKKERILRESLDL